LLLSHVRLLALEKRAVEILSQHPLAPLPLRHWIDRGQAGADPSFPPDHELRLAAPIKDALDAGVVTKTDIAKARNV
jgi:hypothetical protein